MINLLIENIEEMYDQKQRETSVHILCAIFDK